MGREERGWERVDRIVYRGMKGWGRSFSRARVLALQCCCPLLLSWYWSEFYPCSLGTALPINELHALCINQHWCCTSVVDVARILIRWFASPARGHCMICNNTKTCRLAPPAPDISVAMMMVVTTRFLFYLFCALLTWVVTGYCRSLPGFTYKDSQGSKKRANAEKNHNCFSFENFFYEDFKQSRAPLLHEKKQ